MGYDLRDPGPESETGPRVDDLSVSATREADSYIVSFLLSDEFQPWTSQEFDHPWVKAISLAGDPTWNSEGSQKGFVKLTVSKNVDVSSLVEGNAVRIVLIPKSS